MRAAARAALLAPYVPEEWRKTPYKDQGTIFVDGSSRGFAGKYDASGWEVVQLEADGGDIPWYGMCGTILVYINVLRPMTRTDIWTFEGRCQCA